MLHQIEICFAQKKHQTNQIIQVFWQTWIFGGFVPITSPQLVVSILFHSLFLGTGKILIWINFKSGSRYTWCIFRHYFELSARQRYTSFLPSDLTELVRYPETELYFINISYALKTNIAKIRKYSIGKSSISFK